MDSCCKLCLTNDNERFKISGPKGISLNVESIILKHFFVEVSNSDSKNDLICVKCWQIIEGFHKLYEVVANNYQAQEIPILPAGISTIKKEPLITLRKRPIDGGAAPDKSISFEHHTVREHDKNVSDNKANVCHPNDSNTYNLINKYFNLMCDLCSELFISIDDCFIHYEIVHYKIGYLNCCGLKYSNLREIKQHVVWHTNPDAYRCKKCKKSFVDETVLENHVCNIVEIKSEEQDKSMDDEDEEENYDVSSANISQEQNVKCGLEQSETWSHFSRTGVANKVKCNACKHVLLSNSFSNLKKHLLKKHPGILLGNENMSDVNMDNNKNDDEPLANISQEQNTKSRSKRSMTWMHFSRTKVPNIAKCNTCKNDFSSITISNLKKHLLSRHPGILLENQKTTEIQMDNNSDDVEMDLQKDNSSSDHDESSFEIVQSNPLPESLVQIEYVETNQINEQENVFESASEISYSEDEFPADCSEDQSAKKGLKRSDTWTHFSVTDSPNKVKCNKCKKILSSYAISNLKKHLLKMHPRILQKQDNSSDVDVKNVFESANESKYSEDESTTDISKDQNAKRRLKRSDAWTYFTSTDSPNKVKCKQCNHIASNDISTLRKHLLRKHPGVLIKDDNDDVKNVFDSADESTTDGLDQNAKSGLKRSNAWTYFSVTDSPDKMKCKKCKYITSNDISTLRKHLLRKHPGVLKKHDHSSDDDNSKKQKPNKKTCDTWKYFTESDNRNKTKCIICNKVLASNDISNLRKHLLHTHPSTLVQTQDTTRDYSVQSTDKLFETLEENESAEPVTMNRRRSVMWKYFILSKNHPNRAKCRKCGLLFSFSSTANLKKHLVVKHSSKLRQKPNMIKKKSKYYRVNSDDTSETEPSTSKTITKDKSLIKLNNPIWKYFTLTETPDKVKCNICGALHSYKYPTVSNLEQHLIVKHIENLMQEKQNLKKRNTDSENFDT